MGYIELLEFILNWVKLEISLPIKPEEQSCASIHQNIYL